MPLIGRRSLVKGSRYRQTVATSYQQKPSNDCRLTYVTFWSKSLDPCLISLVVPDTKWHSMHHDMCFLPALGDSWVILLEILGSEQLLQVLFGAIDNNQDLSIASAFSSTFTQLQTCRPWPSADQAVLGPYGAHPGLERRIRHLDRLSLCEPTSQRSVRYIQFGGFLYVELAPHI